MDNIKNDSYYIKRIIRNVEILKRYIYEKSLDDLLNDGFLCDAFENRFTKIAEDSCNLSEKYLKENPSEAWKSLPGIRNRICHDYDSVDATTLYKTIKLDFVDFEQKLLNSIRCSTMNLYPVPFKLVKGRTKTVELRLNDEKRRSLKIGDVILFNDTETKEQIIAEIIELKTFPSFDELYSCYSKKEMGYSVEAIANPKDMLLYYSEEKIKQYGALAIKIKVY